MKTVKPPTGFWLETQLTPDMIRYLWSQINKATINTKTRLVGHITSSLSVPDTEGIFTPYILNQCQKLTDKTVSSMNMWVNFQRKYEFNPLHKHSGQLSFVIWMKIPYNFEDEKNRDVVKDLTECKSGCFEFVYCDMLGRSTSYVYRLSPDLEGTMLIFPAELTHQVYPFYTSDLERVSISGNIL